MCNGDIGLVATPSPSYAKKKGLVTQPRSLKLVATNKIAEWSLLKWYTVELCLTDTPE